MIDLSGIWYRVYTEVPFWFLGGAFIFVVDLITIKKKHKKGKKAGFDNKISCFIGAALMVGAIVIFTNYMRDLSEPDIKSMECVFVEEYRDSRVAPPFPFTYGYVFREIGETSSTIVYLDTFSAKKIIREGLVTGELYTVWYSSEDNIIVQLRAK